MTRKREILMVDNGEEDGYAYLSLPVLRDPSSSWDWQENAQCVRFPDVDFFNTGSPSNVVRCKIICDTCVVRNECLNFALRNWEDDGIWGGTTVKERKELRRAGAYCG